MLHKKTYLNEKSKERHPHKHRSNMGNMVVMVFQVLFCLWPDPGTFMHRLDSESSTSDVKIIACATLLRLSESSMLISKRLSDQSS